MGKNLFETKVKDGLWVLAVVVIIGGTSMMMDGVQGWFKTGKIQVELYIPSWDVGSDGASIKAGDAIKLYKMVVGRVKSVDIFVAKVLKPKWGQDGKGKPGSQEVLVSGLKVVANLFKEDYGPGIATVAVDSRVKIESQPLGDSAVLLFASDRGHSISDGDRVNFPRNDLNVVDGENPAPKYGTVLTDPAAIVKILADIEAETKAQPKSATSSENFFEEDPDDDF